MNQQINEAVTRYLASINAHPGGSVPLAELVAGVRRELPTRHRKRLKRSEVVNALDDLGISVGVHDRRQCVVGYSVDPVPALVVDATTGKIQEAA
jgi:hypothetical protein